MKRCWRVSKDGGAKRVFGFVGRLLLFLLLSAWFVVVVFFLIFFFGEGAARLFITPDSRDEQMKKVMPT